LAIELDDHVAGFQARLSGRRVVLDVGDDRAALAGEFVLADVIRADVADACSDAAAADQIHRVLHGRLDIGGVYGLRVAAGRKADGPGRAQGDGREAGSP